MQQPLLPPELRRPVPLTDDDRRAALFLGAARELTNERAGRDTQNNPVENAEGHFLGALAEIAFAKALDETAHAWEWLEPLRLDGGAATRGPRGGDFLLPDLVGSAPPVEIKSISLSKPAVRLNLRGRHGGCVQGCMASGDPLPGSGACHAGRSGSADPGVAERRAAQP